MKSYLEDSKQWEIAVLLTVPLFVVYEIGLLLFSDGGVRNAADVMITKDLLQVHGRTGGLILNGAVFLLFLVAAARGRSRFAPGMLLLLFLESALWSRLIPLMGYLTAGLDGLRIGWDRDLWTDVALGVGAGLYEELLFRLGFVAGGFVLLHRAFGVDRIWAAVIAVLVSSALFSGFHHIGDFGEPWNVQVFTFRFLAGVVLGLLMVFRGLAVCCWTHALYNVGLLLGTA
ncbi:MAG: hypothetical protein CMJ83_22425 [Planctomycetes bacterium]|nr:hypothetical protein [Planctomycetota bacterium]